MTPPVRPKKETGTFPLTARRTSSTICPMLISTQRKPLQPSAAAAISSVGKGQTVMGRMQPIFSPFSRAALTAALAMRAVAP